MVVAYSYFPLKLIGLIFSVSLEIESSSFLANAHEIKSTEQSDLADICPALFIQNVVHRTYECTACY